MLVCRVLTSVVEPASECSSFFTEDGHLVDTLVNDARNAYVKSNVNEVYPDHVLVYR